jgi:hypothetical protein
VTLFSFAAVVVLLAAIVLVPVVLMRRLRRSTDAMQDIPDDLRRSGDGGGPNPAAGPGLGPIWPTD